MKPKKIVNEIALQLRELMTEHQLTQREVSEIALVSQKTVEGWLADPVAASFRGMKERDLQLIRHTLPGYVAARSGRKA